MFLHMLLYVYVCASVCVFKSMFLHMLLYVYVCASVCVFIVLLHIHYRNVCSNIVLLSSLSSTTRNRRGANVDSTRNSFDKSVKLGTALGMGSLCVWPMRMGPRVEKRSVTKCCVEATSNSDCPAHFFN
jgi:hypothetical protein